MPPAGYTTYLSSLAAGNRQRQVTVVRLLSTATMPIEVWFEPWGDMLTLAPGAHYDLVARGSQDAGLGDALTIEWGAGLIKVWAENRIESLAVFKDGALVWEDGDNRLVNDPEAQHEQP